MSPNPPKPYLGKVNFPHNRSCMNLLKKVVDVVGDGHCCFHVVTGLGNMSVDDYQMIGYQLIKELISEDIDCYRRLIGRIND